MLYVLTQGLGYSLSPFLLLPYARNELNIDGRRRRDFNHKISQARIVVEWAFGKLKGRFPALKKLGATRDMGNIYCAIEAMMIVHNMCHEFGDAPHGSREQLDDHDSSAEDEDDEEGGGGDNNDDMANQENTDLLNLGRAFRERCLNLICPL